MISIRCPHCQIGLKVDENKIPANIQAFNCPKCKTPIPITYVKQKQVPDNSETVFLSSPIVNDEKIGKLHVIPNEMTPEQTIQLSEGINIVGRKSSNLKSATSIETEDKLMSRSHIGIEIRKDTKGDYIHYLYDNKSTNRTLYNSKYIEPGKIVILEHHDEIQIGQTRLIFENE